MEMKINEDLDRIYKLETACFTKPWDYDSIKSQLLMTNSIYVLNDVGFALGTSFDGECELYRIGILPEHRGKGEGKKILKEFINKCLDLNDYNCRIFLEVRSLNNAAVSLYKRAGFTQIAVRKNYYGDDDALIFELS